MRDDRRNYIIVGSFLLVMLAALLGWLLLLSGRTGATDSYYLEFKNVMGLSEGAPILYEGYPVGQIEEITFTRGQDAVGYRLDVSIRQGWQIPEDSMGVITQSGFLSPVVIDVLAGKSMRALAPGDRIPSLGTTNILTTMASMANKLGELTDTSLKPLLNNLTKGTGSLQNLFEEAPVIMENLKRFTVEINDTTDRLNMLLDRSGGHLDTILANFETASGNISSLTTDVRQTEKRLDALLVSMNNLVSNNRGEIDHSISDLHHTLEVVASHVREISYNLEATTRNMNELTAEIRRDPGMIIRGRELGEDAEIGRK
jgi:phospholipid/cholesterol/gamma-HCH transport system substrate-binding protein